MCIGLEGRGVFLGERGVCACCSLERRECVCAWERVVLGERGVSVDLGGPVCVFVLGAWCVFCSWCVLFLGVVVCVVGSVVCVPFAPAPAGTRWPIGSR